MNFIDETLKRNKGVLSKDGALMVRTGASTGRSTKERFVVRRSGIENDIAWGNVNQPVDPQKADAYFQRLEAKLAESETFSMCGYVGCFKVEVYSMCPWHVAFAQNMFRDYVIDTLKGQVPDDLTFKVYHDPEGTTKDLGVEWDYDKAIIVDVENLKVGIVGTAYAGEIKKSAFAMCNYLFPKYGLMPMHASANCNEDGSNSSVLFGLSGTGKTTLSADPKRFLIGDDEIVWSANGLSNLEGGCYAKLIHLDADKEPDIYKAANQTGSILENVCFDPNTCEIDFDSDEITENTRASYCISSLEKVFDQKLEANHPKSIVFLTADAFGALPALARLDSAQAQYHFISGYTAKVAGTEIGIVEPEATFSACFGAPFMPRPPRVYADLLNQYCAKHNVPVWILNTGWVNGYQNGDRFPIQVSRQLLSAIQSGELENAEMVTHPIFGFKVPVSVPGVDSQWLKIPDGPQVMELAKKFMANAEKPGVNIPQEIILNGGPRIFQ